jgi:outer membrane lipoprotein-sorting protein
MIKIKAIICFSILCASISISYSQTADDIIDKYVAAVGGMDKINSIQTLRITAKFSAMGQDIPVVQTVKKPDKIKTEITIQGLTMLRVYDGNIGWGINPFQGSKDAEKMNPEETKEMKDQAHFEGKLVNYKDKGSTVELLGKEDLEGTEAYKIKLTDKDGDISTYYIDANSYLLLKETAKRKIKEKEINTETSFGDYKSEDGYIMPHSFEIKSDMGEMGSQKISIDKVEFNVPVDDSIFTMPESK